MAKGLTVALWLGVGATGQLGPPPDLPPLPGSERAPPPEQPKQRPSTPPPAPAPARPSSPPPEPIPDQPPGPAPAPPELPPDPKTLGLPEPDDPRAVDPAAADPFANIEDAEPPQPEVSGPPPAPEKGPGAAPMMPGAEPGLIPGEDEQRPWLPPPERPLYSGVGLFVGAGVTFVIAVVEQSIAHVLVAEECIRPSDGANLETSEDFGNLLVECAPGLVPAAALRIHSDLNLFATVLFSGVGAGLRANRDAWDVVFGEHRIRDRNRSLLIAGGALSGIGFATWLTTSAVAWNMLGNCGDADCAIRARLLAFTTRDLSVAMMAAGVGMLSYGFVARGARRRFERERAISVEPIAGLQMLGIGVRGSL